MSTAIDFASFVIVVVTAFFVGYCRAMVLWNRRMAQGWQYLHLQGVNRPLTIVDITVAFSIADEYVAVRQRALDEHRAAMEGQ